MGVPKFFRWLSERYPLTSQLIEGDRIPEFDNLYLDFNSIIHACSHPPDSSANEPLPEHEIYLAIFAYVEHLFGVIKPKKMVMLAVDGVAPRAKQNQQRSRRFRTALEAQQAHYKNSNGEESWEEYDKRRFDSNCITPGTEFMVRLDKQLRYFIHKKITEDRAWQDVQVVLSGHDVPGEGEHKIMAYIRGLEDTERKGVRHCLYGLDADLIMLGLVCHDRHFCLLREEVQFGGRQRKPPPKHGKGSGGGSGIVKPEKTPFYLLHLSLLREYLSLEFSSLAHSGGVDALGGGDAAISAADPGILAISGFRDQGKMRFAFDLERVINDFILLAVLVGNDFLPNLPDLHIHDQALDRLFEAYKRVVKGGLDGYLMDPSGMIHLDRLQKVLDELSEWEKEVWAREQVDAGWLRGKGVEPKGKPKGKKKDAGNGLVLTVEQSSLLDKVSQFVMDGQLKQLKIANDMPARDRAFLSKLGDELRIGVAWDGWEASPDGHEMNVVILTKPGRRSTPGAAVVGMRDSGDGIEEATAVDPDNVPVDDEEETHAPPDSEDSEEEEESQAAIMRVLDKYARAPVQQDKTVDERADDEDRKMEERMSEWRWDYYREKLGFKTQEELDDLVHNYIEGLQWVMYYYYRGVQSWAWFFKYHYAPRIGDLKNIMRFAPLKFDLGQPFKPFEQLMSVLPVASSRLVPPGYRTLMSDPNSPIVEFYPTEFEQDMNGKRAEWEAVVKIPFIDIGRLRAALGLREHILTQDERARNTISGAGRTFTQRKGGEGVFYASPLTGYFPNLARDVCEEDSWVEKPPVSESGASQAHVEAFRAGFPSLKALRHSAVLGVHGVNVHGTESRNRSVVVSVHEDPGTTRAPVEKELLSGDDGKRVYVNWPFLREAKVIGVSDREGRTEIQRLVSTGPARIIRTPHRDHGSMWRSKAERIEEIYSKKRGVLSGDVAVLVHVQPLTGMTRVSTENGYAMAKTFETAANAIFDVPLQLLVKALPPGWEEDPRYIEKAVADVVKIGERCFFLGEHAYGGVGRIDALVDNGKAVSVVLAFEPEAQEEVDALRAVVVNAASGGGDTGRWWTSYEAANSLGISNRAIGRITSSFMVLTGNSKTNVGLSIKFEGKGLRVAGYSRKRGHTWEYNAKAVELLQAYQDACPGIFRVLEGGQDMVRAEEVPGGIDEVKRARKWLAEQGVRDFTPVPVDSAEISPEAVKLIEAFLADPTRPGAGGAGKKALVKGVPREALLMPIDAPHRLKDQKFATGDRVVSVSDSGNVPMGGKGVVIGTSGTEVKVVFDSPFMGGTGLGGLCSAYRGAVVDPSAMLNLTDRQFIMGAGPGQRAQPVQAPPPRTGFAEHANGARGAPPMRIMARGRGAPPFANGRGSALQVAPQAPMLVGGPAARGAFEPRGRGRGGPFVARGGFVPRGADPNFVPRGRGRGRGRGAFGA